MKYGLIIAVVLVCCALPTPAAADNYLTRLLGAMDQTGSNLTALAKSAETAAARFVAGGNLWVAGRQEDFIAEACGRAGGLTAIAALGQRMPKKHDVVLYAVPGALDAADGKLLQEWQEQGATVVPFSSRAGLYGGRFPMDTVLNVMELWTWTGEFVATCTRLGKMPVLYESYGLPGGRERAAKYKGRRFHDDFVIKSIPPEVLGGEYRKQIEGMLRSIMDTQMPKLAEGAQWWHEAGSTRLLFTGHMFPRHVEDPRTQAPENVSPVPAWEDKEVLDASHPPQCAIYVGYQYAPRQLIAQARELGVKLVYFTVEPGEPAEAGNKILYINPDWPLADGCVRVPGYDVPILPASGVVDAAIYWAMRERAVPLGRKRAAGTGDGG